MDPDNVTPNPEARTEPTTYVFGYPDRSEQYENCVELRIYADRTGHAWANGGDTICEIAAGWETMCSFSESAHTEAAPVAPVAETIPVVISFVTPDVAPSPEPEAGASSTEIMPDVPVDAPHIAEVVTNTTEG